MDNKIIKPRITFGNELRFSPYAYAKLIWMRDRGDTEVAGYGITGTEDPLFITDVVLVKQECTEASFDFDPADGAEHMERMTDAGLMPWMYSNILLHTHPGNSPHPSQTDEKNFAEAFSHPNWAIMFIIANGGETYCRLKINVGPGVEKLIKVKIDYNQEFPASDHNAWKKEYKEKVFKKKFRMTKKEGVTSSNDTVLHDQNYSLLDDEYMDFATMLAERDRVAEKLEANINQCGLSDLDCFWSTDGCVEYWDNDDDIWYAYDPISQLWYTEYIDKDNFVNTEVPNRPWVEHIIAWAEKYIDERHLAIESVD